MAYEVVMKGDNCIKMTGLKPSETENERFRRVMTSGVMSVELVSAFAGDREITEAEKVEILKQEERRGSRFYSDLLYSISHHYFAPEIAKDLWSEILLHKHLVSERLGRDVRITVATLDYLSNITSALKTPTLITEVFISKMANLSMRDGMTGLFNHTSFYELLELELKNHRRYGAGLSMILLDIDDFKSVNDQLGHQQGDRILIEVAKTMEEQVRESDICCRFGGEEFAVILPSTKEAAEAREIAERIRAGAAGITCPGQRITVSVGVAVCDWAITSTQGLVERADQALYTAKRDGKNRVVLSIANLVEPD